MALLIDFLWLLAGLTALYFGAEWLVNGAAKLAMRFGISPLVVGLTVVAFGTSAPELFVSIKFNNSGLPDMALGNVIGSNICNIALVLGISAFICILNIKAQLLFRDLPVLIVATLVFSWMQMNGVISHLEGALLFSSVIGYTIFQLYLARKVKNPEVLTEFAEEYSPAEALHTPVWKLVVLIFAGLVALYFGAGWLEDGGVGIAKFFKVPDAVISLTLIAFSTSVPELATSVVASLKKEGDIITGNVIGSCIFNLLCVMGLTSVIKPIQTSQIEMSDLWVMIGLTVLLLPMMMTKKRISRVEGGILLACYAGYCVFLWITRISVA
ncbi:MAG: hypothetical protein CMO55_07700 [Verrucomicrobiales bacterium]|nr:hypothetical protein [Verrucomicrobiales bacterium]